MRVYPATNINDHYQYFNSNTKSLPNGLGFGGQFDYFALWVQSDFIHGHCRGNPSTTFANHPLSANEEFEIEYGT